MPVMSHKLKQKEVLISSKTKQMCKNTTCLWKRLRKLLGIYSKTAQTVRKRCGSGWGITGEFVEAVEKEREIEYSYF